MRNRKLKIVLVVEMNKSSGETEGGNIIDVEKPQ